MHSRGEEGVGVEVRVKRGNSRCVEEWVGGEGSRVRGGGERGWLRECEEGGWWQYVGGGGGVEVETGEIGVVAQT